jgi:hypothetical protein
MNAVGETVREREVDVNAFEVDGLDVKELKSLESLVRRAKRGKLSQTQSTKLRAGLATCRETRLEEFRNGMPKAKPGYKAVLEYFAGPSCKDRLKTGFERTLNTLEAMAAEGDLEALQLLSEEPKWGESAEGK